MDSVNIGILDIDARGTTGIGTVYYMDVTLDGVTTRHQWGLLEQLSGAVKPSLWSQAALDKIQQAIDDRSTAEKQEKLDSMKKREDNVVVDDVLKRLVSAVCSDPLAHKAIAEYRAGKEKALNSLVGLVIKQIRAEQLSVTFDAFTINRALQTALK